jgi:hypothetical protein
MSEMLLYFVFLLRGHCKENASWGCEESELVLWEGIIIVPSFWFDIMIQCILFMQVVHVVYYFHSFTAKDFTLLSTSGCLLVYSS